MELDVSLKDLNVCEAIFKEVKFFVSGQVHEQVRCVELCYVFKNAPVLRYSICCGMEARIA